MVIKMKNNAAERYYVCSNCGESQSTTEFGECAECGYEDLVEVVRNPEQDELSNSKEIVMLSLDGQEPEIYALKGCKAGDKAVMVQYNFSTGSQAGCHNFLDSFALAQAGRLGESFEFEEIVYSEEDVPNRQMVGKPKEYECWDYAADEIDWDAYVTWINAYCEQVL